MCAGPLLPQLTPSTRYWAHYFLGNLAGELLQRRLNVINARSLNQRVVGWACIRHHHKFQQSSLVLPVQTHVMLSFFLPSLGMDAVQHARGRDAASCSCSCIVQGSRRVRRRAKLTARRRGLRCCAGSNTGPKVPRLTHVLMSASPPDFHVPPRSPPVVRDYPCCGHPARPRRIWLKASALTGRGGESGHHWVRPCWVYGGHIRCASKPAAGHVRGLHGGRRARWTAYDHHGCRELSWIS